jgi:uncharacterized protein YxeA
MKKILVKLILLLILFSLIASCTYSQSIQAETDGGDDPLSLMVRFQFRLKPMVGTIRCL